jgi:hypothetical protein
MSLVIKILIICASLLLSAALFIAAVSLWVGFSHQDREGFWVPLLAGCLLVALAVLLYIRLLRALLKAMNRSDILRS